MACRLPPTADLPNLKVREFKERFESFFPLIQQVSAMDQDQRISLSLRQYPGGDYRFAKCCRCAEHAVIVTSQSQRRFHLRQSQTAPKLDVDLITDEALVINVNFYAIKFWVLKCRQANETVQQSRGQISLFDVDKIAADNAYFLGERTSDQNILFCGSVGLRPWFV